MSIATADLQTGRINQKLRTRQALLDAAGELLDEGVEPTLEVVAERAMVSRATAYRYFPSIDALVAELAIERAATAVAGAVVSEGDLAARVEAAVVAPAEVMLDNEVAMHVIAKSLSELWLASDEPVPVRPGRRMPFIDRALERDRERLGDAASSRLRSALGLVSGMEAVISARDVVGLDRTETIATLRWVAHAVLVAAERDARETRVEVTQ